MRAERHAVFACGCELSRLNCCLQPSPPSFDEKAMNPLSPGKLCSAFLGLLLCTSLLTAEPPALEPLADVTQDTRTEIKVALKAKDGADKPLRFAIARVRQDG